MTVLDRRGFLRLSTAAGMPTGALYVYARMLIRLHLDHRPLRMNRIASALALLGDAELVPELLRILARCGCDRSSVTLAYTLGHTGDARVVGPLIAMLDDEAASDRKRAWASYALGLAADRRELPWVARYATQVDYLDAPPSLMSPYGGALLDQR